MVNFFTYDLHITTTKHRKIQYTFRLITLYYQPNTIKFTCIKLIYNCKRLYQLRFINYGQLRQPNRPYMRKHCKSLAMHEKLKWDSLHILSIQLTKSFKNDTAMLMISWWMPPSPSLSYMKLSWINTATAKPFVLSIWGRLHESKENYDGSDTWISFLHSFLSSNMPL